MIVLFKRVFRKVLVAILWFFPKRSAHKILYFFQMKRVLNLKKPSDFNEKIQWLIVNEHGIRESKLADKYQVRKYIKEKKLGNILPKLYGVYNDANEISFNKLPDSFVLKTNHGCGNIFICKNKNDFDFDHAKKILNKSLKKNYAKNSLEYHYQNIDPIIICEEFLDDGIHSQPEDYKFYCFNGHVDCIMLCSNRDKHLKLDYFDRNWNYLNYSIKKYQSHKNHPKPKKLAEMIKIAEIISKGLKFVRVDLYEIGNKIYFGEMTFTPASGLIYYNTSDALKHFGELLDL